MANKKRAKNQPTKGDVLAQQYRNRVAMFRVYEAASDARQGVPSVITRNVYWTPLDIRKFGM